MKTEKVAKRKNKPRKLKGIKDCETKLSRNCEEEHPPVGSPVESHSSGDSNDSVTEDVFLVDQVSTDPNIIDICDIAERCVLEELSSNVNTDEIIMDISNDLESSSSCSAIMDLMPSIKFTIEEEYRLCELQASKELLTKAMVETWCEGVPNFREKIGMMLFSKSMGISLDITTEQIINFLNIAR